MSPLHDLERWSPEYDLRFVAETPVCGHCHHYNLFIDKTVNDALGLAGGAKLRTEAAREFFWALLNRAVLDLHIDEPASRLKLAEDLFRTWGHGRLELGGLTPQGGLAVGQTLHYSFSWREKFGDQPRYSPADALAAGFAAAAMAVAFDLPPHEVEATETLCLAMGHESCEFRLRRVQGAAPLQPPVSRQATLDVLPKSFGGRSEDEVQRLTEGLRDFLSGVKGDERGLIEAFGVFVTFSPVNIYNRLSYEMLETLSQRHESFARVSAGLLREAGRMCGFNTFGGIIGSPEWEALTGTSERDALTVALHSCTIARGLGFGRWSVADFEPGRLLILQTPSTYEGPYYKLRHGEGATPSCYLFEGACEAIAQLGHAVDWSSTPAFTPEFYDQMSNDPDNQWQAEQTHCVSCGDDHCEVIVTRQLR